MNFKKIAKDYLRKAEARRKAVAVLMDEKSYDDVVRESQEVVELILKGTLRHIGIDPPKRHDVGDLLPKFKDRLPANWHSRLAEIETISKTHFEERGHAFYGDESSLMPASELFGKEDAQRALAWTDQLLVLFRSLINSSSS